MDQVELFGVPVQNTDLQSAVDTLIDRAAFGQRTLAGFVNTHFVNLLLDEAMPRIITDRFDLWFADGAGVAMAAWLRGTRLAGNVNGTDMFPLLCRQAEAENLSMFLFGAKPGIAETAGTNAKAKYGVDIAGTSNGFISDADTEELIHTINESGADILLVGLGMPTQEEWILEHSASLKPSVIVAVGGLFDFYSGAIPRAPKLMRSMHVEWLWRLAQEPTRLWRRYLLGILKFGWRLRSVG